MVDTNPVVIREALKRISEASSGTSAIDIRSEYFHEAEDVSPQFNIAIYPIHPPTIGWETGGRNWEMHGGNFLRYLNVVYAGKKPSYGAYHPAFHSYPSAIEEVAPLTEDFLTVAFAPDEPSLLLDPAVRKTWLESFLQIFARVSAVEEWADTYSDEDGAVYLELTKSIDRRMTLISRDVSIHLLWHIGEDMGSSEYSLANGVDKNFIDLFVRLIGEFQTVGEDNVEPENNGS